MDFGTALEAMKNGGRVAREAWAPHDIWCCYMPPIDMPAKVVSPRIRKFVPSGDVKIGGYLVMYMFDGTWQPGWMPSVVDMQSEDWIELPPAEGSRIVRLVT